MLWQHGEENLKISLEALNCCHPTIKFTADYSKHSVNFLDVSVKKLSNRLITDVYIKPTDTHQYLHASSCHVFHSKKSVPFSQALRFNRICSENAFFDKRCNELEVWLKSRGYSDKTVRSQILEARKYRRSDLLNKEKRGVNQNNKLFLNITYHPSLSRFKHTLNDIHILLTPDKEHKKVFENVPIVGLRKGKSIKDFLVRAKVPPPQKPKGGCTSCSGKRCQICNVIKTTDNFQVITKDKKYFIRKVNLNCNTSHVIYLIECKTCGKPYIGSTETPFRARFNNY